VRYLLDAGQHVVLLGSPDEKPLCDEIEAGSRKPEARSINLAGRTDIATMIALLARARLVLANDSGPLHIAAALGTRVVALYGPTSPSFVGPYGQLENVLRQEAPCHPCRLRECDHHSCMNGLTVEMVWRRVAAGLGTETSGPPDKETRRQGDKETT
jgi:lipopolysaccharide heptosyltransferase II